MEIGGAAAHPSPGEVFASENAALEESLENFFFFFFQRPPLPTPNLSRKP